MLLLDWAKAFDRIDPAAMYHALLRFGVPPQMVDMISASRSYESATSAVRTAKAMANAALEIGS